MQFSERYGFKPVKNLIQTESMDQDLRNSIWNALQLFYFDTSSTYRQHRLGSLSDAPNRDMSVLCKTLWINFFKEPLDTLKDDWQEVYLRIRRWFFESKWFQAYDFIEFVPQNFPD